MNVEWVLHQLTIAESQGGVQCDGVSGQVLFVFGVVTALHCCDKVEPISLRDLLFSIIPQTSVQYYPLFWLKRNQISLFLYLGVSKQALVLSVHSGGGLPFDGCTILVAHTVRPCPEGMWKVWAYVSLHFEIHAIIIITAFIIIY